MQKIILAVIIAPILLFGTACHKKNEFEKKSYFIMGTLVEITLPANKTAEFENLKIMMRNLSDEVMKDSAKISETGKKVEIGKLVYNLLKDEENYYKMSDGRFNSGVFIISSLYGFPEGPFAVPDRASLNEAKKILISSRIKIFEESGRYYAQGDGLKIDLGAFAKGAIVDDAARYLQNIGVRNFIVNAGGDLYASGDKRGVQWRLGIADPEKRLDYMATVSLKDKALATSGTYERFFITKDGRRISHIFNGKSGEPADGYKSLSVIADDAKTADALSTVYFFMDEMEIARECAKNNTPVLTIGENGEMKSFCKWDEYSAK